MEEKKWYVIHTYSGFEEKVAEALRKRIETSGMSELFGEILVPDERVIESKGGKKIEKKRKFFPGYIFVNMVLNNETWNIVRRTPRVAGFVGGKNPVEISEVEVGRLSDQIKEGKLKPKPKFQFTEGETVKIIDGPFTNFEGIVDEVKKDKGKVRVLVKIFGRPTPVELDFHQVEKIVE